MRVGGLSDSSDEGVGERPILVGSDCFRGDLFDLGAMIRPMKAEAGGGRAVRLCNEGFYLFAAEGKSEILTVCDWRGLETRTRGAGYRYGCEVSLKSTVSMVSTGLSFEVLLRREYRRFFFFSLLFFLYIYSKYPESNKGIAYYSTETTVPNYQHNHETRYSMIKAGLRQK